MLIDICVPQLSESVADATLMAWQKAVGEPVRRDEILLSIETDKVVLDVSAPANGALREIIKGEGETALAGEVIARFEPSEQVAASVTSAVPAPPMHSAPPLQQQAKNVAPRMAISPMNLDVSLVERPSKRVPMSRLRERVAERLQQSQWQNVILTTFNEVNMAPLMALRKLEQPRFEREHGLRLGFMSFFVKAVVLALQEFPILNASVDGSDIVYHDYFDVGIAVGSARGLVVPILRDADQLSVLQIEQKIAEFSRKASAGSLALEDLAGGTFSISNGGVYGSMLSTPIINPPQSAILGIHATKDRPVVENGEVVIRPINYFALSYDHRIIDGREAVLGLAAMKRALENPKQLLAET